MNKVLKDLFLFKNCDYESLNDKYSIEVTCFEKSVKKGGNIPFNDNDSGLPLILSGTATILTGTGNLIRFATVGEMLGVASVFGESNAKSTMIIAHTDCKVLYFPGDLLNAILKNEFEVTRNYLAFLSDRVSFLNKKLNILTQGSAEQKLAVFLSGFGKKEFTLPISYIELAKYLSIGRASLYRVLDDFCDNNIITRKDKNIVINDFNKLKNIYGG